MISPNPLIMSTPSVTCVQSVGAYDALYLALAEAPAAPLLTCDVELARANGHVAEIVLIEH